MIRSSDRILDAHNECSEADTSLIQRNAKLTNSTNLLLLALLAIFCFLSLAHAQAASPANSAGATIHGKVLDANGAIVANALIHINHSGSRDSDAHSDNDGEFSISGLSAGTYVLTAELSGARSRAVAVTISTPQDQPQINLTFQNSADQSSRQTSAQGMDFADNPDFKVAGVTDWTAAGGHGSDSSLRTSEALTRETLMLKPDTSAHSTSTPPADAALAKETESKLRAALVSAPANYEANHQLGHFYLQQGRYRESASFLKAAYQINPENAENEYELAQACKEVGDFSQAQDHVHRLLARRETADVHHLAGTIDEKLGDPLAAVHEFEQAVRIEPTEQNYFDWGSELLFHRAILQAREVFDQGVKAYPKSARMLTALGATLFAGAFYDDAAQRLCNASDLNPADPEPYTFMGKIEIAAPNPLPCIEQKLARFAQIQPANSLANYFYAMALWKSSGPSTDPKTTQQIEAMLNKAVTIDPKCADGYLQLGNLQSSQRNYKDAIEFYTKAIEANPQLSDAHYRLGMAYDRVGEKEKASAEFQQHDAIEKQTAAEIQRQRKEVKQFVVVLPGQSTAAPLN